MSELRDYQQDLLEQVHRLLDAPDARVMLQLTIKRPKFESSRTLCQSDIPVLVSVG